MAHSRRRTLVAGLALAAFALAFFVLGTLSASATTVYVDDNFPSDDPATHQWTTVQEGIDDAAPGDTVYVYDGTYVEDLTVSNNSITLQGQSQAGVIIDRSSSPSVPVLTVNANHFLAQNLTLMRGSSGLYVDQPGESNGTLENVTITQISGSCAYVYQGNDWTLHEVTISSCSNYGIFVQGNGNNAANFHMWAVTVDTTSSYGIYLYNLGGAQLSEFTLQDPTSYGLYGSYLNNVRVSHFTINSSSYYGVYLSNSAGVQFDNGSLRNSSYSGMYLYSTDYGRLDNITTENNSYTGIEWWYSSYWTWRSLRLNDVNLPLYMYYPNPPVLSYFQHDVDQSNQIRGVPIVYFTNATGGSFTGQASWFAAVNSSGLSITSTALVTGQSVGVSVLWTNGSTFTDINATNNDWGFILEVSNNNTFRNTSVAGMRAGSGTAAWLHYSNDNVFDGGNWTNTSKSNTGADVSASSSNNTFQHLAIRGWSYAMFFHQDTSDNRIANSTFEDGYEPVRMDYVTSATVEWCRFNNTQYETIIVTGSTGIYAIERITVHNSTFNHSYYYYSQAIYITYATGGLIENNTFNDTYRSLYFDQSSGVLVRNNDFRYAREYEVYASYSAGIEFYGNSFTQALSGGVLLDRSAYFRFRSNTWVDQSNAVYFSFPGDFVEAWANHDLDTSNIMNGLPILWVNNATSGSYSGAYAFVLVTNSTNVTVTSTANLTRDPCSLLFIYANDSTARYLNASGSGWGACIMASFHSQVIDSNFDGMGSGVYVWNSAFFTLARTRLRPYSYRNGYGLQADTASNNVTADAVDCSGFNQCVHTEYYTNFVALLNSTVNDTNTGFYSQSEYGTRVEGSRFTNTSYESINVYAYSSRMAQGLRIANNTIAGASYYYGTGIYLYYPYGPVIENNTVDATYNGLLLYSAFGGLVQDNHVNGSRNIGIYTQYSTFVRLDNNLLTLNAGGGVYLERSTFLRLRGNSITNQSYAINLYIYPTMTVEETIHDADSSNTVGGIPILWIVNATSGAFNGSYGWLAASNTSNVSLTSTSPLSRNSCGAMLMFTTDTLVHHVNATANGWGACVYFGTRSSVADSAINNNTGGGVYVYHTTFTTVARVLLRPNSGYSTNGVNFDDTSANGVVDSVDCAQFSYCVLMGYYTNDNAIVNSTIANCSYGLYSYSGSGPRVEGSTFRNMVYEMVTAYGHTSTNIRIANNTFDHVTYYYGRAMIIYYYAGGVIENNTWNDSWDGAYFYSSSGLLFQDNRALFARNDGIYGQYSSYVTYRNNRFETPLANWAVEIDNSRYFSFSGNIFANLSRPVGIDSPDPVTDETLYMHYWTADNLINGQPVRYYVNATGVTFSGPAGWIVAVNSTGMDLTSTTLMGPSYSGVIFVKVFNSTLRSLNITGTSYGVYMGWGADNVITGATINNSTCAIALSNATRTWVDASRFTNSTGSCAAVYAYYGSTQVNVTRSTFTNVYRAFHEHYTAGIANFTNNTVEGGSYGVYVDQADGVRVLDSAFNGSFYSSIYLYGSGSLTVDGTVIARNRINGTTYYYGWGIEAYYVYNGLFDSNLVTNSPYGGIYLQYSNTNLVRNSTFRFGQYGIYLYQADSNIIVDSTVSNMSNYVVLLDSGSDSNILYHDNFYGTAGQTRDFGLSNLWSNTYPAGGNYWSNMTSRTDVNRGPTQAVAGADGINDTALFLGDGKRDSFPLMEPWPPYVTLVGPANLSVIRPGVLLDWNISTYFDTAQYALNNGTTVNWSSPWDINTTAMGDGDITVQVWANDTWYNISSWFQFAIDNTAPSISADSPPVGGTYPVGTQLNFTVADPHLVANVTWNNGSGNNAFAAPWQISTAGWAEGDYNITIRAWDGAGNNRTSTFLFKLDSTAPTVTLVSPSNNSFIAVGTTIDLSVFDVHLNVVTWNNGSGPNAFTAPFDISTAGWGSATWNITVTANDTAGFTTTRVFTFTIDAVPPTIALNTPANNSVFDPGVTLDFDVSDTNLASVTYNIGSGPVAITAPFDLSTTGWADGTYNVTIVANDTSGNSATRTFHFEVDSLAPAISTVFPSAGAYIRGGQTADFAIVDAHFQSATWSNGSGNNPLTAPFDVSLVGWADGSYTIVVNATDAVGHSSSSSVSFTIDSVAPTVTLNSPANNSYFAVGRLLDFAAGDTNLASVVASTGGAFSALGSPYDISTTGFADGALTVRINATDLAGNFLNTSFSFTIDSVGPAVTIASPANNSYFAAGRLLDFAVSDANLGSVVASTGGAFSSLASPYDISTAGFSEGALTVRINATDLAGNFLNVSFTFTVDSTAPTVVLNSPANNSYFAVGRLLDFAAADTNLLSVVASTGGAYASLGSPYDISTTGFSDGVLTVRINATDLAGNFLNVSFTFTIDSTGPSVTAVSPSNNSYFAAGRLLDFAVSDANIGSVVASTGGAFSPLASPYDISTAGFSDGALTVRINATDLAGNFLNISFSFTIDSVAPTVVLNSPSNNSYFAVGRLLDFAAADTNLQSVVASTGGAFASLASPYDISTTGFSDGALTVRINATDLAGNFLNVSFSFTIDSSAPTVTLSSPSNNSYFAAGRTLDFVVGDTNLATVVSSTGGAFSSLASPYDISTAGFSDGALAVRINATDLAGNFLNISFSFTVDSALPTVTLLTPSAGSVIRAGTTLDFAVSDTNLGTVVSSTGGAYTTLASPYDISTTGLPDGSITVRVNATDLAGNFRNSSFTFTVDSTTPTVSLLSPTAGAYFAAGRTLDFAVSDSNLGSVLSSTGGAYSTLASPYDISTAGFSDGALTVRINATDQAGNFANVSFTFTVDSTLPTLTLNGPASGAVVRAATILDFSVSDTNLFTAVWSNGGAYTNLSASFDIDTTGWADGSYTVRVNATDLAGNFRNQSYTFEVDSTPPSIVQTGPGPGAFVPVGTKINLTISDAHLVNTTYERFHNSASMGNATLGAPFQIDTASWSDGDSVIVHADDSAGNSRNFTVLITFDSLGPSIVLISPFNGSVIRAGTLLIWNISDPSLQNASINNGTSDLPFVSPWTVSTAGYLERNYNFTLYARDGANNTTVARFNFTIDSTPPQVQLLSPANNSWLRAGMTIDFGVTDLHLTAVNATIDGVPAALAAGYDYSSDSLADGVHTFLIAATDAAGNARNLTAVFRVDKLAPAVSVAPADGAFVHSGAVWYFNITEPNIGTVLFATDNVSRAFQPFGAPFLFDTTGWAEGAYERVVQVTDAAGNSIEVIARLTVDDSAPAVTVSLAKGAKYIRSGVPIVFHVSGESVLPAYTFYLRGVPQTLTDDGTGDYSWSFSPGDEDGGDWDIDLTFTDGAGNRWAQQFTLKVDNTPPALPPKFPMAYGGSEDAPFEFHGAATDALASADELTWRWDTCPLCLEVVTGQDSNWTFSDPGNYQIEVSVTDPAGNGNNTTFVITVFDITPPQVFVNTTFLSINEDTPFQISQTSIDNGNGTLNWTWREPTFNLTSNGPNITWIFETPGVYNITLTVRDPSNNTGQGYVIVDVQDITPPDVVITGPAVSDVLVPVNFRANATDNDVRYNASQWTFAWTFTSASGSSTASGPTATYVGLESGQVNVTVRVTDASGNRATVTTALTINRPPVVGANPPASANATEPWVWLPDIIDPENASTTISIIQAPPGMTVTSDGHLVWTPSASDIGTNVSVTVAVSDGVSTVFRTFSVHVVDPTNIAGNHKPVFNSDPVTDASVFKTYLYDVNVTDPDNDPLSFVITGLDGSSFDNITRQLSWVPPWHPVGDQPFEQLVSVTITAFDGKQSTSQDFVIRFRNPPNQFPLYLPSFGVGTHVNGTNMRIPLELNFRDPDDVITNLTFFVNSTDFDFRARVSGIVTWTVEANATNPGHYDIVFHFVGVGQIDIPFAARDPSGARTESIPVRVTVVDPQTQAPAGFPLWLLLLILGAIGAGGIGMVVALRRSRSATKVAQSALEAAAKAPTERVIIQQAPAVAGAGEKRKDTYVIEGVFVIYQDGRMIFSKTDASDVKLEDPELVASMFSAVQSFIKDSFQATGELNRLGFGENTILIERGTSIFMAAIIYGEPQDDLFLAMKETVTTIENAYAGIIEDWDGSTTSLEAIDQYVLPFLALTAARSRADVKAAMTEKIVKMLSELEFFQGFVRLKCGVKNDTESVITKVTVSIDFNEDVLRLHHIEPDTYKVQGSETQLGVLNPGEKVSVAYYFDPQICTESQIDGVARYRDAKGAVHSLSMKTRKAEVVCPIFFTKEHANTAMLKRLVEGELEQRDSKVFNITAMPEKMTYEELFSLVKEVVLAHDVHLVRDFVKEEPYHGEAWFYGETKVKGYKIVIRASVMEDGKRIEFFAASTAIAAITGLLAEFNHTFQSLVGRKFATLKFESEFDPAVKEDIQKKSLMAKMSAGELEGAETDQE